MSKILWLVGVMVGCQVLAPVGLLHSAVGGTPQHFVLPEPRGYVSDYAEILDAEWQFRIASVCRELEERTGIEMVVVTVPTAHPLVSAREYASKLYGGWRIGMAQQERGILLLAAVNERQAAVVLGRKLLSVISRTQLDELSKHQLVPMFHTSTFGPGLYQAVVMLASASGQMTPPQEGKAKSRAGFWMNLTAGLVMLYALWRFTRPERRHPFQRWRRGEYWGTGQGGFGGNFGGFGGGMGGQGLS